MNTAVHYLVPPQIRRLSLARSAAAGAAFFLLGNVVLAIAAPGQPGDHATAAGRLSEGSVGASFLAGAVAFAALLPRPSSARWFWLLGIIGLGASGLTMLAVFTTALEPPFQVFLAEVALTVPALAAGLAGAVAGTGQRRSHGRTGLGRTRLGGPGWAG